MRLVIFGSPNEKGHGRAIYETLRFDDDGVVGFNFETYERAGNGDVPMYIENGNYSSRFHREMSRYVNDHDSILIVTPEYNGMITGLLKDIIDSLYHEWKDKVVQVVTYGYSNGGLGAYDDIERLGKRLGFNTTLLESIDLNKFIEDSKM